jgi:hypothetical protein
VRHLAALHVRADDAPARSGERLAFVERRLAEVERAGELHLGRVHPDGLELGGAALGSGIAFEAVFFRARHLGGAGGRNGGRKAGRSGGTEKRTTGNACHAVIS